MKSLPDFVSSAPPAASQAFQLAVGLADNLLDVTDNASLAALFALDCNLTGKVGLLDVHNARRKSAQERCALLLAHKGTLDEANDAPAPSSDSPGGTLTSSASGVAAMEPQATLQARIPQYLAASVARPASQEGSNVPDDDSGPRRKHQPALSTARFSPASSPSAAPRQKPPLLPEEPEPSEKRDRRSAENPDSAEAEPTRQSSSEGGTAVAPAVRDQPRPGHGCTAEQAELSTPPRPPSPPPTLPPTPPPALQQAPTPRLAAGRSPQPAPQRSHAARRGPSILHALLTAAALAALALHMPHSDPPHAATHAAARTTHQPMPTDPLSPAVMPNDRSVGAHVPPHQCAAPRPGRSQGPHAAHPASRHCSDSRTARRARRWGRSDGHVDPGRHARRHDEPDQAP